LLAHSSGGAARIGRRFPLTREEILRQGWKIDLIEKIPTPADKPSQSPRGLPLYQYKLVISR